jgi:cell division protein FtsX
VFMAPDATDEQVAAVRSVLGADREIGDLQYVDRAGAWEQARTVFADEPALLSAMSPEMLPTNFAFSLPLVEGKAHEPESLAGVRGMSGVKEVKAVRSLTCTDADAVMIAAHRRFVENRFGDGEVAVYIHPARVDAVPMLRDRLLAMPSVRGIVFVSQDDALPELRCLAWDDPDVTKFGRDDAPVTFVLDLGDDASVASEVALSIQSLGGVESVAIRSTDAEIVMDSVNAVREGRHPAGEPDCPTKGQRIR